MSKYGIFSGPCLPVSSPNTGKYGPEKSPYSETFHVVIGDKKDKKWTSLYLHPVISKPLPTVEFSRIFFCVFLFLFFPEGVVEFKMINQRLK